MTLNIDETMEPGTFRVERDEDDELIGLTFSDLATAETMVALLKYEMETKQ